MEHQTIEIHATGKLKGFTFTGFDGERFMVRETVEGFRAIRKALNSPSKAIYARTEFSRKGKLISVFVIAISIEGVLYSHQGKPGLLDLLEGLPVRQVKK